MTTREFKIGAVYSPDGGKTNILIAAPTREELESAWKALTFIRLNPNLIIDIESIEGADRCPRPRAITKVVEPPKNAPEKKAPKPPNVYEPPVFTIKETLKEPAKVRKIKAGCRGFDHPHFHP